MKCQELLQLLNEYVDGTLDPSFCDEFERHMAGCNPCQLVVDNIRNTITLYKSGQPSELPVPFRNQLHALLRDRWHLIRPKNGRLTSEQVDGTDRSKLPMQNGES
jgi:anti-sigma factor RsiW